MLSDDLTRYVELHHSLGFKFRSQEILLRNFVAFAEQRAERFISTSCVLDWAGQAPSPQQRRNRLLTVRRFALAVKAENVQHQVPPASAFGNQSFQRIQPHIYTSAELHALLKEAGNLSPKGSIRPVAYVTLFGLLAATGLRISEALALLLDDVIRDGLVIRETKFHKSRLIPLHTTVSQRLNHYLEIRGRMGILDPSVFVSLRGTAMNENTVRGVFLDVACAAGLRDKSGSRGPRIHDLRHTFAVRSIEQCGADPKIIRRHITALSTYLGHAHVTDTYWYLQATPKLTTQIAIAGENLFAGDTP